MADVTCPNGCDLRGAAMDPEHFDPALHDVDPKHHAESMERYGRCFCLPYGDRALEDRFFSRVVALYDDRTDRTVAFVCPDCGVRWDR